MTRNRRWFIYRDKDKKEIASIRNAEDFAGIVMRLARYVENNYIDIADDKDLTLAIQIALPEGVEWPIESSIDIFIKGAEKFKRTYRKADFCNNAGKESSDAFSWIVFNLSVINEYHNGTAVRAVPDAVIECDEDIQNIVRKDLYKLLIKTAEMTRDPESYARRIHVINGKSF